MDGYFGNSDLYNLNYGLDPSLGLQANLGTGYSFDGSGGLGLSYDGVGGGLEPQEYYDLYGTPLNGGSGSNSVWGKVLDGLGGVGGLAQLGLGGLGMYGNYQAYKDQQNNAQDLLGLQRDQLNLQKELGLGALDLQRDQFALGSGVDDMASKALGMQLLVNRGKMAPEQTNPWLNFMFQGRQQMFGQDPKVSAAFASNPFADFSTGVANFHPGVGALRESISSPQPGVTPTYGVGNMLDDSGINRLNALTATQGLARGGQFQGRGGLGSVQGLLAGATGGQDDAINARLADGEYVMDAETVSALGDGNTAAGAKKLDAMRHEIRRHKRKSPIDDIPPRARDPKRYMKGDI